MRISGTIAATVIILVATGGALAETTCDSVRTDITGQNVFGQHTMKQLSQDTQAGNCDAAAYLARRAKDAQGFVETHCPDARDLDDLAATMLKLGQDTLGTSKCQD